MVTKIKSLFLGVRQEMAKVSWPTLPELRSSTMVVIVVTFIISMFIFFVDFGLNYIVKFFLK